MLPAAIDIADGDLGAAVQFTTPNALQCRHRPVTFYDVKVAAGGSHHAALRALGNRWLEIRWDCLRLGVTYDEQVHTAD
ncbi:hypothetical protein ACFPIJ_16795 [Dactylosporangium cerinum]|uniref:Uncharacterized protein n=1 Tax=Dactylosporangium cerinum TaxID=1434730 RepID=A0ABV9VVY6_9ACTN